MGLDLDKDNGNGVGNGNEVSDREKKVDPEKMQEKIKNIYKKKTATTKSILKTEVLPTIYEPITFGSVSSSLRREEERGIERKPGEPIIEGLESTQGKTAQIDPINVFQSIFPVKKIQEKIDSDFTELAKVIGYNDIQTNALPQDKSLDQVWKENSAWLQNLLFEFFLVFFSYIITYNIYYFSFIYKWDVETAHYDPKQGFLFGGVFKSIMDDWFMRDIRYPMLFMGYIYSWLIPAFFNLIGVIHYPKLCFIIILLHTMIIAFTQGPNAAMSVESLLGGSPSVLILILNLASCFSAFFNTSFTLENALAWVRFANLFLLSCISNAIRLLIAFLGVFISQIMVYLFFFYTTSGFGLLWEAKFVNIGEKIQEINAHINGNSGVGKNYCKAGEDTIGLWGFINKQVEPHFSWLFIYLLMLYIIVKTIATFYMYNGESAKLFLCYFFIILGVIIWLVVTSVFKAGSNSMEALTNIVVSAEEPNKSMWEKAKAGVKGLSEMRKRTLTNLSNQGNNFLSKTVGQTARNARNFASSNIISRNVLGDDTFTALKPEDQATLQEITASLNDIVTNVDSTNVDEPKKVEEDIRSLLSNNKDIYQLLSNIFEQPKIQTYISSKIAKGKSVSDVLTSMFEFILSRAGANPKVTSLVSTILANMDYGSVSGVKEKEEVKSQ